jgi:hypothetical protein
VVSGEKIQRSIRMSKEDREEKERREALRAFLNATR